MLSINKKGSATYSLIIYNFIRYKKAKVKYERYFNQQISKHEFKLVVKLVANKCYKNLFFYLLFSLSSCFHF